MRIWIAIGMLMATTVAAYAAEPLCPKSMPFRDWLRWVLSVLSLRLSGSAGGANKDGQHKGNRT